MSENYSELDTGKNSISSCTDIILDQFLGKEV